MTPTGMGPASLSTMRTVVEKLWIELSNVVRLESATNTMASAFSRR